MTEHHHQPPFLFTCPQDGFGSIVSLLFVTIQAQQCDILGIYGVPKLLPKPDDIDIVLPHPSHHSMVIEVAFAVGKLQGPGHRADINHIYAVTRTTGQAPFVPPLNTRTPHKPVCVIYASHSWKILWIPHTPIPVVVSCLFYFFSCQADNQILNNIKVAFVSWQTMRIMHEQKAPNPQHATNLDLGPHLLAKNLNASVGTNMSENNGQLTCALSCFQ